MKKTLLLFLLALPAIAQGPVHEAFPSDYKPSPCAADPAAVCKSFEKNRIIEYAALFRGFDLKQAWVDSHWDEMMGLFAPFCTKIANCFPVKDNTWVFCIDLMRDDFIDTCERFPLGSDDRSQCRMLAITYVTGIAGISDLHKAAQECAAKQPSTGLHRLEAWVRPEKMDLNYNGELTVFAYDAETHLPVRANLSVDAGKLTRTDGPAAAGSILKWRAGLKRVPNAQNHRDVVLPTATLEATGYEPLTIHFPVDVPTAKVTVTPPAAEWKPGTNTITVTAVDSVTGKPVEMRVMAGETVLGDTNRPLQLELAAGQKRPEIWVTSLFDHYSDVVVAEKQ
jgi:hypothetical protein